MNFVRWHHPHFDKSLRRKPELRLKFILPHPSTKYPCRFPFTSFCSPSTAFCHRFCPSLTDRFHSTSLFIRTKPGVPTAWSLGFSSRTLCCGFVQSLSHLCLAYSSKFVSTAAVQYPPLLPHKYWLIFILSACAVDLHNRLPCTPNNTHPRSRIR